MELIDKAVVLAEIERQLHYVNSWLEGSKRVGGARSNVYFRMIGNKNVLEDIKDFINTLKTKEVDLDKESMNYLLNEHKSPLTKVMHGVDLGTEMQYHKDIQNAYKAGYNKAMEE